MPHKNKYGHEEPTDSESSGDEKEEEVEDTSKGRYGYDYLPH